MGSELLQVLVGRRFMFENHLVEVLKVNARADAEVELVVLDYSNATVPKMTLEAFVEGIAIDGSAKP